MTGPASGSDGSATNPIDGSGTTRARCVLAPEPVADDAGRHQHLADRRAGRDRGDRDRPRPLHQGHLRRVHDTAEQAGLRIAQIILTHGHPDHSEGARTFADLTGAPVRAVDPTHRLGSEGLPPGAVVSVGGCEIEVIATPGHTIDSVSLYLRADAAVLTGDTVLGRGTTVIARDGNLSDYLASLGTLHALADKTELRALLPGHGPLLDDPLGALDFYIKHRAERIAEIKAALAAGDRTKDEIVARVYAEVASGTLARSLAKRFRPT